MPLYKRMVFANGKMWASYTISPPPMRNLDLLVNGNAMQVLPENNWARRMSRVLLSGATRRNALRNV